MTPTPVPTMIAFFPLIAIALLLLTPLVILLINLLRGSTHFGIQWIIAVLASLAAWPLILISRSAAPMVISLAHWRIDGMNPNGESLILAIRLDHISWSYAIAISTLLCAVLLTAAARMKYVNWRAWAGNLILTGLGLLAIFAGNPLTLLLAWTALDLVELVIHLSQVYDSPTRRQIIVSFSARVGGSGMLLLGMLIAWSGGTILTYDAIPTNTIIMLLLSAGLRMGILPLHIPFLQDIPLRRGLGTVLRLVPAAGSLILITRLANTNLPLELTPPILTLTAIAALVGAGLWMTARNELNGRVAWLIGTGALAFAASIQGVPAASLAWGIASILPAGALFLYFPRRRYLSLLVLAGGGIALSSLPFSLTWSGSLMYPFSSSTSAEIGVLQQIAWSLTFLAAQSLLITGYISHVLRRDLPPPGDLSRSRPVELAAHGLESGADDLERWAWLIYPLGLILVLSVQLWLGWLLHPGIPDVSWISWLVGIVVLGLSVLLWYGQQSWKQSLRALRLQEADRPWQEMISLSGIFNPIARAFALLSRLLTFVSTSLEGEGGILWALVILALIFTFLLR